MNILVTGSSGFLGKFLCKKLKEEGHSVTGVQSRNCDLTEKDSLHQFDTTRFDRIYHLAAWTQAGDFCLRHPGEQWIINQQINTHVLSWWQSSQPQAKLICMGTSCSYDPELPLEEEYYLNGQPIDSLFTYGMTKRMLLCGLMALHRQYGLNYLYLVPSTLYGPGYHTDGRQMHFIFDLIRKIWRGKLYGEAVELWGDGHQKRELVHICDFVDTMEQLVDHASNTIINIGAGREYSIREFAQKICDHVGYAFEEIGFDLSKYVGAKSKLLSVKRLNQWLPDFSPIDVDRGLAATVAWFYDERKTLLPPLSHV